MDIIAHRGASHDAPENTLAAFKLGWQQRADAVELDIWLTKDGKLVVCHDADTKRTTGTAAKIPESTLADLRALDAGAWKAPQWKGELLPTLDEALALIPDGKRLVIEIKCGVEVLPELERVIKAAGKPAAQLVIISFSHPVCAAAKKLFPQIPVLYLASFKQDKATGAWSPTPDSLIAKAKAAQLDGLNLAWQGHSTPRLCSRPTLPASSSTSGPWTTPRPRVGSSPPAWTASPPTDQSGSARSCAESFRACAVTCPRIVFAARDHHPAS